MISQDFHHYEIFQDWSFLPCWRIRFEAKLLEEFDGFQTLDWRRNMVCSRLGSQVCLNQGLPNQQGKARLGSASRIKNSHTFSDVSVSGPLRQPDTFNTQSKPQERQLFTVLSLALILGLMADTLGLRASPTRNCSGRRSMERHNLKKMGFFWR